MKERILSLKAEGKTNTEIVEILGCAKSTVSYHCSDTVKQKYRDYRNRNRKKCIHDLKENAGGKCCICGYNRCFDALSFHHTDPSKKDGCVSNMVYDAGKAAAEEEVKKCILVCANCHLEIHNGMIDI